VKDLDTEWLSGSQDAAKVYNAGLSLLARREHSGKELRRKLGRRFAEPLVDQAVAMLSQNGLLSDERFAEALIHVRRAKGYGPRYIAQDLSQKGISKELIQELLDERDGDWVKQARQVVLKKIRTTSRMADAFNEVEEGALSADEVREHQRQQLAARQKLSTFLFRRGFPSEIVQAAMMGEFPPS
jgi:regulatory protein